MDLLDELGLWDEFAKLPQSRLETVQLPTAAGPVRFGDFTQLSGPHNYIAMVPQWDLLDLLADAAKQESSFTLRMETEATDLVRDHGRVVGVEYRTAAGETGQILADLTVAADGRRSVLRSAADLKVRDYPTPLDVWWFRLPRESTDPSGAVGVMSRSRAVIMLDRNDYWQTAVLIRKGSDAEERAVPVSEMVASIVEVAPWLGDRVDAVSSWDDVKLLDVRLDRLNRWYQDGLLCIGDAAHAMSPVGGVGINLAVQDAVAAARLLAAPLKAGTVTTGDLAKVQRRRLLPTAVVQGGQRFLHARVLKQALAGNIEIAKATKLPLPVRMMKRFPWLRRIPAYVVGRGIRPEHAPDFARR
jgi:2-polyprenyl-6-methoxyphenol hydroxylase-like FAD-dependent oxidoreductase